MHWFDINLVVQHFHELSTLKDAAKGVIQAFGQSMSGLSRKG